MVWRKIPDIPYEANELGDIRHFITKQTAPISDKYGKYILVRLSLAGTVKWFDLHRLVCAAWYGMPVTKEVCRHLDNDHKNNHKDNLSWGSQRENMIDKWGPSAGRQGEFHPRASLSDTKVRQIIEDHQNAKGPDGKLPKGVRKMLINKHGVSLYTYEHIVYGETWRHLERSGG